MKILLTLPLLLLSLISFPSWSETIYDSRELDYDEQENTWSLNGKPFTGELWMLDGDRGKLVNGKKVGPHYYYSSRVLWRENYNSEGRRHGFTKFYAKDGTIDQFVLYIDGKKQGLAIEWRGDKIRKSESYYNDKLHGTTFWYRDNGSLRLMENYKHGLLDGTRIYFGTESGVREVKHYKDGKCNGLVRIYHWNGTLGASGWCSEGRADGRWYSYHEDGTLNHRESVFYQNGVKISD